METCAEVFLFILKQVNLFICHIAKSLICQVLSNLLADIFFIETNIFIAVLQNQPVDMSYLNGKSKILNGSGIFFKIYGLIQ